MRKTFLLIAFFFMGCVSPVSSNPIDFNVDYAGTYKSSGMVVEKRYLYFDLANNGDFSLWFQGGGTPTKPTTGDTRYFIDIPGTNITGSDPNYSFKMERGYGTFTFLDTNRVKISFFTIIEPYYSMNEPVNCWKVQ